MKKKSILVSLVALLGLVGVSCSFSGATFNLLRNVERSAGGLEQRQIEVKGLRIEYLEGGKGETLVLLHGFGANKDNWTRMAKHLTPHFRVIAPDLPGFGESASNPDGDYTILVQAERVKEFVQALGIKSFHLGGNSMGGFIAGAYGSRFPEDLKSLLLIAPAGVAAAEPSDLFRLLLAGKPNPLIAENEKDYEVLLDFVFVKRPFLPWPIKKFLAREAVARQPLNSRIFQQLRSSADTPPLEVMLKGLPAPTLIIWGREDRVLHVSGAKILASVMPRAKTEIMDKVGHAPMIEKPQETAARYLGFVKEAP
ncbi:MAG: alpha/beta hydrolase [Smithellaceae bacterium]|nr:alpha/beta hydrolase [Smithellaceae bacterium]